MLVAESASTIAMKAVREGVLPTSRGRPIRWDGKDRGVQVGGCPA